MRKIAKIIFNTLSTLSLKKIIKLLSLVLPHPLFAILSFYATIKSFTLAQKHFPKTNSNDGIGNAFRHALWCCLIMMYCCKISSPEKSLKWCKKMTDLHEELFPNELLQTQMDLHNNKVGMNLFMELLPGIHRQFFETGFFTDFLLKKTKTAAVLRHPDENHGNELVYLE
ncbi:DUF6973 domain-containing protein [Chryseobacterium lacus]|uniref:DUF6973 domain-containing protein n=1 Tax=Chryseobacterium lacus TaxID=2058346 RepID=UPI000F872F7C|nr:hypothetical protein [Chryseobacterium lacus]RST25625.1 hypothetical protein EIZ46_09455 [Chryseobacterium lacus]